MFCIHSFVRAKVNEQEIQILLIKLSNGSPCSVYYNTVMWIISCQRAVCHNHNMVILMKKKIYNVRCGWVFFLSASNRTTNTHCVYTYLKVYLFTFCFNEMEKAKLFEWIKHKKKVRRRKQYIIIYRQLSVNVEVCG